MTTVREMGFLEKIATLFQETASDSTCVAIMIGLDNSIDFDQFKAAWRVMFARHPMLRARKIGENLAWSFKFDVNFDEINIKHSKARTFHDVDIEYSQVINRTFDTRKHLWRATLAEVGDKSYIIVGASHAISDGKSLSWLLGDLLRCIIELEAGKQPDTTSYPVPEPFYKIINRKFFTPPAQPPAFPEQILSFEGSPSVTPPVSKNRYQIIEPKQLRQLVANCKQHNVTITSALTAALAQTIFNTITPNKREIIFSVAVDMRPYTEPRVAERVLAFYAHQIMFILERNPKISFWELAQHAMQQYRSALKEYNLISPDDHATIQELKQAALDAIANQQCFIPYTLSNVGIVDAAFKDCERFNIKDFFFTVQNQLLFNFIVFASTINERLCLNFNYCDPVISDKTMDGLIDDTMHSLQAASK